MAYRRRQGITRASTFKEDIYHKPDDQDDFKSSKLRSSYTFNSSSSLAAQALRASAVHRDSSISSAYSADSVSPRSKVFDAYDNSSDRSDDKGFWGVLAKKAKEILEDDNASQQFGTPARSRFQMSESPVDGQSPGSGQPHKGFKKTDSPTFRKSLDKITSSLNHIGDTFEKAFEEGMTMMENKTANIIQETRKLQIRRRGNGSESQNEDFGASTSWQQPMMQPKLAQNQMSPETQLKASRDVAMATAAKAKLLLRELKTVKADLAFAKQRCSQLEDENKVLREGREKGGNPADDDLIRLQLETLLAEKARLAHENSIFARENRFLREIVEYYQLTMQDVVYIDEGNEEVAEVYPITRMLSITPTSPISPLSPSDATASPSLAMAKEMFPVPVKEGFAGDTSPFSAMPRIEEEEEMEEESKIVNREDERKSSQDVEKHNSKTTSS